MIERIWKRIISSQPPSLLWLPALMLYPLSGLYWIGLKFKKMLAAAPLKLKQPVLSVGNLTLGGTGKTPTVEFLTRDLIREGYRVGIVSGGYARKDASGLVKPGYEIQNMSADRVGDEVKYLAGHLPEAIFAIDRTKTIAARKLVGAYEVDLIIVDDGFQHSGLHRDLDLVTYDAALKQRTLKLFPRGVLREPLNSLGRADIVILTRAKFAEDIGKLRQRLQGLYPQADYYQAKFTATELMGQDRTLSIKYLEDKSVFLFAGVGNFAALRKQVQALSADIDQAMELADHQAYDQAILERIKKEADRQDSDLLLTTGKDWVKLGNFDFGREIYYLNQVIDLDPGEERLILSIKEKLALPNLEN